MTNIEFSEAATDVIDILKHTRAEDVKKISNKFITFLEENSSKTYIAELDHTKSISKMDLKPATKKLLTFIYFKYLTNDEEKKEIRKELSNNENTYQNELNKTFNVENLFKNKKEIIEIQVPLIIEKENYIKRIIKKIIKRIANIFSKT